MAKSLLETKTVKFQIVMGAIDAIIVGSQTIEPFMSASVFAIVFLTLSVVHKAGSTYLRLITKEPVSVR